VTGDSKLSHQELLRNSPNNKQLTSRQSIERNVPSTATMNSVRACRRDRPLSKYAARVAKW
jgi:hypothetical protein